MTITKFSLHKIKQFLFSTVGSSIVVAAFILAAMIAIIGAQGRVITPDLKIEETSIIRINSNISPRKFEKEKIQVLINEREVLIKNNVIEFLKPGDTIVRIVSENYKNWFKFINLKPSIIHDIYPFLIPQNLDFKQILATSKIVNAKISDDKTTLFIFSSDESTDNKMNLLKAELKNINTTNDGSYNILTQNVFTFNQDLSKLLNEHKYDFMPSHDKSSGIIHFNELKETYVLFLNENTKNQNFFRINDKLNFTPNKINWIDSERILVEQNSNLFDYNIKSDEINVIYLSVEKDYVYAINEKEIVLSRISEPKLFRYDHNTKKRLEINTPKNFIYPS
ncbi:MAG: hypothetical protein NZZ41_07360, partial [Candidatus Dojkabacteria bacterium]|nr:hypothetical protein [Candidatus Dojkabacteria bacterium]